MTTPDYAATLEAIKRLDSMAPADCNFTCSDYIDLYEDTIKAALQAAASGCEVVTVDEDEAFRYMMQQEGFKQVNSLRWPEAVTHFLDYLKENSMGVVKISKAEGLKQERNYGEL